VDSFEAFLDDYFAESDEHLAGARRTLLTLESALAKPGTERAPLEELFRIFHSIKGISAMVELRPAEQLAHELESYLRAVRQREIPLTAAGVDLLMDGVTRLEQVIGARKQSTVMPPIDDVVSRMTALIPSSPAVSGAPSDVPQPPAVVEQWRACFEPSRELLARGVGVDVVRRRLAEIGEIVSAAPHVRDDGSIEFRFVMMIPAGEAVTIPLRDLGVRFERVAAPLPDRDVENAAEDLAPPAVSAVTPSHYVRVDLARLDELMRSVADLVISRARLADSLARIERHVPPMEWRGIQENAVAIDRQLRTLREGIMRVRLVPVGEIFRRMPFVVRDLARSMGKRVGLQLIGQATEIDKYVIERMMDPVLHLVRNSVTHGIETPDQRVAAGKSPEGTLTLSASTSGDVVTIEVSDDGRGIDPEAVALRARAGGVAVPSGQLDAAALLTIICSPGFSTRDESDRGAGRGVGMAVVKTTVEQLSGTLALDTHHGTGTRFTITLPLTLAITDALIVRTGTETFAVPQGSVREVLEIRESDVNALERNEVVPYRDGALPIVRLGRLFGIDAGARDRHHVFVVGHGANAVGVIVDRIVGQREVVVRSIGDPLVRVDGISGATDLGDGHVVLILDPPSIARLARQRAGGVALRVEAT
jgi:two-component system chemotaxis sensor kinase CheA